MTNEEFYEVPFHAPRNERGEKPRYIDIWHPDERIGISTINSAVTDFASQFLDLKNVDVELGEIEEFEESLRSYKEHMRLFDNCENIEIKFSDELVEQLAILWKESTSEVLDKLKRAVQ